MVTPTRFSDRRLLQSSVAAVLAELSCNDGREVSARWTADSCTSGYGTGFERKTSAKFQFAFGMSEPDALARFETQTQAVADRPALPDYRPKETRKEIGFSTGTAFLVSSNVALITNYHVIEDAKEISVIFNGELRPAMIVVEDQENDAVLLKADVTGMPIPYRRNPNTDVAEKVMTLGYPLVSIQGQSLKISFGRVNALFRSRRRDPEFAGCPKDS